MMSESENATDLSPVTADGELLWRLYQDEAAQTRHCQTLAAVTNAALLAVAAGLLAFLGATQSWPLDYPQLPLALVVVLLGIFGAFFSVKYHERSVYHGTRAEAYLDRIDSRSPGLDRKKLLAEADSKTQARYGRLYRQHLHRYWLWLYLLISLLGLLLALSVLLPAPANSGDDTQIEQTVLRH